MRTRLLLPLLVILFVCAPAKAQSLNCSDIRATITELKQTLSPDGTTVVAQTNTYKVTCQDTATLTVYSTQSNTNSATGQEGQDVTTGYPIECNPEFFINFVVPYYATSQNAFTNIAQSFIVGFSGSLLSPPYCTMSSQTNVTTYCTPLACASGGGSAGGGGGCDPSLCYSFYVKGGGRMQFVTSGCCKESPILIDVGGTGFVLTSAENGVKFDIAGTGTSVQMGWTAPGADNAFLALPGADGLIHSGQQLFGNFTPQPSSANPNGFAALAVYDDPKNGGNGNGVIDAGDAIFASLRLWIDANHDGISQVEELHTLPSLGVNSISLKYREDGRMDQYGNIFHYRAQVNPGGPTSTGRMAYDVFFVSPGPSPTTTTKNLLNPEGNKCTVPAQVKGGMLSTTGTLR